MLCGVGLGHHHQEVAAAQRRRGRVMLLLVTRRHRRRRRRRRHLYRCCCCFCCSRHRRLGCWCSRVRSLLRASATAATPATLLACRSYGRHNCGQTRIELDPSHPRLSQHLRIQAMESLNRSPVELAFPNYTDYTGSGAHLPIITPARHLPLSLQPMHPL